MEKLGDILKNTRIEKGLTLEQVEEDTKIRKRYLEAMENEQWEVFSDYFYLRNFLRTYCRYLNLENREYLYFLIENLRPKSRPQKLPEKIELTSAPRRKTGVVFGIIAIILLFTTSYIYKLHLIPQPDLSEAPQISEKERPDEKVPAQEDEQGQLEKPEEQQTPAEITSFQLSLKCIDDRCWVEVNSEEQSLYRGMMVKDDEVTFSDLQRVTFKLGNAGQMWVFINEENLGILGEIGEVITKTYMLENGDIKEL